MKRNAILWGNWDSCCISVCLILRSVISHVNLSSATDLHSNIHANATLCCEAGNVPTFNRVKQLVRPVVVTGALITGVVYRGQFSWVT
jgi:hypothetical protein